MISGASAGNIEQMALGVVDLFQVGVVSYSFDAFLRRNNLIVARHHNYRAKFKSFRQMHGAERYITAGCFNMLVEYLERQSGLADRSTGAIQFRVRTDEHTDLVWRNSLAASIT